MSSSESSSKSSSKSCYPKVIAWMVVIFFIAIGVIGAIVFNQRPDLKDKVKDTFISLLKSQPLKYPKTTLNIPGNCSPYRGCASGSSLANPIALKTGKRPVEAEQVWCDVKTVWRDCNAFQDCVDGKCQAKP